MLDNFGGILNTSGTSDGTSGICFRSKKSKDPRHFLRFAQATGRLCASRLKQEQASGIRDLCFTYPKTRNIGEPNCEIESK